MIPFPSLCPDQKESRRYPCNKRDPEVDKNALGDLRDAHVDGYSVQTKIRWQNGDEYPRVQAVEDDLKNTIEGDKSRCVFAAAARELIPNDHHRDTPREADHDQSDHVIGMIPEKDDRQREHQQRTDHPILEE